LRRYNEDEDEGEGDGSAAVLCTTIDGGMA
jgi:hypothetical protein